MTFIPTIESNHVYFIMSNRTSFRLPGYDLHPLAERKCLLSLLAAYSRQWNPRNLESPWYEPWAQILAALVADHPSFSVAPQPYLWYDASSTSEPHTTPGPDFLLSSNDENLDELMDEVGNVTLDSIRSISLSPHRNRARIPDFAITRKVSFPRPDNTSSFSHLSRRVTYVGFPLLAELKAAGHRSDDIRASLLNATMPIHYARNQVIKQACHLFRMYPHQQAVILIAISGFWWSYMIYPRELAERQPLVEEEEEESEEADEPASGFDDKGGIHSFLKQGLPKSDEEIAQALQDQLDAYGFALGSLGDMAEKFHNILPEGQLQLAEGGIWSKYLLYGTAPSNQIFSLILDRLHDVVHYFYQGERG